MHFNLAEEDVHNSPKKKGRPRKFPSEQPRTEFEIQEMHKRIQARKINLREKEAFIHERRSLRPPPDVQPQSSEYPTDSYVEPFEGDDMMDADGYFIPGSLKEHRIRIFHLFDRDETKIYMALSDMSKALGFQDVAQVLRQYPDLPYFYLTPIEREDLIDEGHLHPVMKTRNVPVLQAATVYRVFGSRIWRVIKKGFEKDPIAQKGSSAFLIGEEFDTFHTGRLKDGWTSIAFGKGLSRTSLVKVREDVHPDIEGGDWIYQTALSAAEFNTRLRYERRNRLWNEAVPDAMTKEAADKKAKSIEKHYDEDMSEDDHSIHSDEEVKPREVEKQPDVGYGFYDVHTHVYQVPKNTQIVHWTLNRAPLTLSQFLAKVDPDEINARVDACYSKPEKTSPVQFQTFPQLSDIFHKQLSPQLYPISLLPGQAGFAYSLYAGKFKRSAPVSLPASNVQPQEDKFDPRYNYCGYPNLKAKPCSQRVPKPYDRCASHKGLAPVPGFEGIVATAAESPVSDTLLDDAVCTVCSARLLNDTQPMPKNRLILSVARCKSLQTLVCHACHSYTHISCLSHYTPVMFGKDYSCGECQVCTVCRSAAKNKGELLLCDVCDDAWHEKCLTDGHDPSKDFTCPSCRTCHHCGKHQDTTQYICVDTERMQLVSLSASELQARHHASTPSRIRFVAVSCDACAGNYLDGQFCIVCHKQDALKHCITCPAQFHVTCAKSETQCLACHLLQRSGTRPKRAVIEDKALGVFQGDTESDLKQIQHVLEYLEGGVKKKRKVDKLDIDAYQKRNLVRAGKDGYCLVLS